MTDQLTEEKQALKVRIFALAKELGMDSKVLIQHCNDAGIPVKASALASISPAERDVVLEHLQKKSAKSSPSDSKTKTRDVSPDLAGKSREIKTMGARTMTPVARAGTTAKPPALIERPAKSEPVTPIEPAKPAAQETPQQPIAPVEVAVPKPAKSKTVKPVAVEQEPPIEEAPELSPAPVEDIVPAEAIVESLEQPLEQPIPPGMRREDYISPHGAPRMREMRPIGSTGDIRPTGSIRKSKPNLPQLAAIPDAPVMKARKDDAKAQKPDMKLSADFDAAGPLAGRVSQVVDGKKVPVVKKRSSSGAIIDDDEAAKKKAHAGGLIESRDERRQRRHTRVEVTDDDDDQRGGRKFRQPKRRVHVSQELRSHAAVEVPISIRMFSEALGRPAKMFLGILYKQGHMLKINDVIDEDTAIELALEVGVELAILREKDLEEELQETLTVIDPPEALVTRPPIVTILGHVDHGKTTLLDKIRSTNVAAGEAGGITQHIRAYQIIHNGHPITFVDTPGHAAFGEMRARGANCTDIVVLVVAANDGVMPQTIECIAHAKASGATIVVAMNKIDLPDRNEQKLLSDLATHGVLVQEWGGEVEMVRTSGLSGAGIDDLLELLLLTAEVHELKANPERPAVGVCMEAFRDEGRGVLALVMVRNGTLRVGEILLCGGSHGNIRAMYNDHDQEILEATPSTPVRVAGLDIMPNAGDQFFVMDDLDACREIAEIRQQRGRTTNLAGRGRKRTMDDILLAARGGAPQELPLILKADTPGSIEALKYELGKFDHPEVKVNLLHSAVGGVNESDVYLASASGAIIIAFHVIAEDRAMQLADAEGVEIRRYQIIYEVADEIKRSLEGLLPPEQRQVSTGRALVLQTFSISRIGTIAGCRVLSGTIERSNRVRLIRDQKILHDYPLASLKRIKDDVREVRDGMECGIRLENFNDVKEGDLLEAYRIEEVKRTID